MKISWRSLEHEWRKQLLSHAKGNILEVGVGTGINFKYYPVEVEVTGVDMSARIIEKAKEEAIVQGVKTTFIESGIEDLEFPEQSFDTVVSTFSLSAYHNPGKVLMKFNEWCKPDGMILLLEYGLSKYGLISWAQKKYETHYYRKSGNHLGRDLLSIISASELQVKRVEIKYAGIVYLVWATLVPRMN